MAGDSEKILKIRFRFPGGEEFEAEGSQEFIEQQRNYFLALIGKKMSGPASAIPAPRKRTTYPLPGGPKPTASQTVPASPLFSPTDIPQTATNAQTPLPLLSSVPPALRGETAVQADMPLADIPQPVRLWEQLLKEEGDIVVLRRKMRLSAAEAASLLVAGVRVLLKKPNYPALHLSQSMRKSGFDEGRLDRILAPEIRNGHLASDGSKRSRTYRLTNEGFAKAFVLAEKLAKELL